MSIQDLLKDVTVQDLTTFARAIPSPADFLLTGNGTNGILPNVLLNDVKWRLTSDGSYVNVAKYRAYDSSVPFGTREAWQTAKEGSLPALGQKLLVGEQEQLLLDASRGADADRLVELLYNDVERHVKSIRSRLELAAGDVLTDGKLTISENGFTTEVDFGVPAANLPTAAVLWSDPTSDPLKDELGWIEYLADQGLPEPEMVLTSRRAWSYLASNNAYRAAYYGSVNPSNTPTASLNPAQVNVVRGNYGLPPVTLYKAQVRVDGTATKVLSDDRWLMLPPDRQNWAQTLYGATAESLVLSRGSNPEIAAEDAPGIVITRGIQDDPVQIWTKGAAVAMPVMHTPDAYICAKVL
jgi:hypothetical protein